MCHFFLSSICPVAGEWKDGQMHGVGTFEAPNGARYQGGWACDLKHGLGKQNFSSGDVYEVGGEW